MTAAVAIPILRTPRLILRGWRSGDEHAMAAMRSDAEVVRYLGGKTDASMSGAYDTILRYTGHWLLHGNGKWAVEERATGQVVGRVGYLDLPYDWPGLELGWTFLRAAWGKGYATEAAVVARDWVFRERNVDHILSMIHPDNAASMGVAVKIGETRTGTFTPPGEEEQTIWSLTRADWKRLSPAAASPPNSRNPG